VTSGPYKEPARHMVCCNVSTKWRQLKLQGNDTQHLWMGMGLDNHIVSMGRPYPTRLKCLFVIEDADLSVRGLIAFVQPLATRPILQTAGMVIVDERHQPQTQPFQDGSYCHTPLFSVGTTYIIPQSVLQGGVNVLPLILQSDSSQ
jgi:hypothetical protein